jgi:hypothetical protein
MRIYAFRRNEQWLYFRRFIINTIAFRSIPERYRCDYTEIDAL